MSFLQYLLYCIVKCQRKAANCENTCVLQLYNAAHITCNRYFLINVYKDLFKSEISVTSVPSWPLCHQEPFDIRCFRQEMVITKIESTSRAQWEKGSSRELQIEKMITRFTGGISCESGRQISICLLYCRLNFRCKSTTKGKSCLSYA